MASAGNRHCANYIGTVSFVPYGVAHTTLHVLRASARSVAALPAAHVPRSAIYRLDVCVRVQFPGSAPGNVRRRVAGHFPSPAYSP